MSKINKILVVGASIAGPAMCYWLKKFGFSPTLIEKNSTLRKGGFAIDIRGVAVEVAKKMGIYEEVCEKRTQLKHGCYVDTNGNTLVEEEGEKFGFRQGEDVEIVRGDLVDILMQSIKDIPCYFNQEIIRIEQDNETTKVTFKDGRVENYDLIMGCDGLHSSVRRMVFTQHEYELVSLGSYISVFSVPNYLNLNQSEMLYESNQKLVSLCSDKNPDVALAGFMFLSDYRFDDIRDEKEQKNFLKDSFMNLGWESNKILEFMEASNDFYFDAVMQVKMKSCTKGRVALVGDAGYCPSPLSGQGTYLALIGAYILAGELKLAGDDYIKAFEHYNQLLHPFANISQDFGVWVSKNFLLPDEASTEVVSARAENVLEKLGAVTNAIKLPQY